MSDWTAAMRRALTVDGGTEPVPMLLALADERPGHGPARADSGADADDVVTRLQECRAALAPTVRDDDLGVVTTLLATVADREWDEP